MFEDELGTGMKLVNKMNVVNIKHFVREKMWIIMEKFDQSLEDAFWESKGTGKVPTDQFLHENMLPIVFEIAKQASASINVMHSRNLVHLDIAPR